MEDEKKEETVNSETKDNKTETKEDVKDLPRRQIVIETDGSNIFVPKCETTMLELTAILTKILQNTNR